MKITDEFIKQGMSGNGGWNKPQLESLGVSWPPKAGWKRRLVGKEISQEQADNFLRLRNRKSSNPSIPVQNKLNLYDRVDQLEKLVDDLHQRVGELESKMEILLPSLH